MRHVQVLCWGLVLSSLTACGPLTGNPIGKGPQAEDYDQSCQQDADCVIVFLDRACTCSEIVAVNVSEEASVKEDNAHESRFEDRCLSSVECDYALFTASCENAQCVRVQAMEP